jgi:steroid delta-isomerase-like uncharacterized protein
LAAATTTSPVVDRWAEAWNAHSPEQMAELFSADGVYEDLAFGFALEGKEGVANWVSITLAGAPDLHVDVVYSFQVDDRAAAHWIFSGTHTGAWGPDLPPTGEPFSLPVASLFELDGDLIRRVGDYYNLATWLRQVGLPYGPYTPPETVSASTEPESTVPGSTLPD